MMEFTVRTSRKTQFLNITEEVGRAVCDLGVREGGITVFVPHTTAGITINENADPDVVADIIETLERLVPWRAGYRHGEGNAAAHVKASLLGSSVRVPVKSGRLCLGTWQGIYLCEFDGPRTRTVWMTVGG
jgi:secondary thiamine-phosphate synthase enzyme